MRDSGHQFKVTKVTQSLSFPIFPALVTAALSLPISENFAQPLQGNDNIYAISTDHFDGSANICEYKDEGNGFTDGMDKECLPSGNREYWK